MQSNLIEPQHLPQLPPPSVIEHWVYQTPIPLALASLALGLILFVTLRKSLKARTSRFAPLALALGVLFAGAIFLVGSRITTAREELIARSIMLVKATAAGDGATLNKLLDEQIKVRTPLGSPAGKKNVVNLITKAAQGSIGSPRVRRINAGLLGPQIAQTQIRVKVRTELLPILSWWRVDWARPTPESSEWVATRIEPFWIQGFANPRGSD